MDADLEAKIRELAYPITAASGVSLDAMKSRSRRASVVRARHQLMLALWRHGMSTVEVGECLGLDHTTVMSGLRKLLGREQYTRELRERWLERPRLRVSP